MLQNTFQFLSSRVNPLTVLGVSESSEVDFDSRTTRLCHVPLSHKESHSFVTSFFVYDPTKTILRTLRMSVLPSL